MSETRSPDPLRRQPPVIDMDAKEVRPADPKGAPPDPKGASPDPKAAQPEPETAIEPVATTGLGSEPFPKTAADPAVKAGTGATASEPAAKPAVKTGAAPATGAPTDVGRVSDAGDTKPAAPEPRTAVPGTGPRPASSAQLDLKRVPSPATEAPKPAAPDPKPVTSVTPKAATPDPKPAAGPATPGPVTPGLAKSDPAKSDPAKSGPIKVEPAVVAASPPVERSRSVLPAALAAGIVGAILSAAAVWFLLRSGDGGLADRLATLERRVTALPTGNPAAGLEPRLSALEGAVRQAAEDARAARAAADAATRQAGTQPTGPSGETKGALDAVTARVEEVGRQSGAAVAGLGSLGQKVDALGTRLADGLAAAGTATAAVGAAVTGLQTDATTFRTSLAGAETRLGEEEKKLASVSTTLDSVAADLGRLQPAASQAGLRIAVSGRLDDALRSGAPLGPAIGALEKLGVEGGLLAPLRPYATAAAPSAASLLAAFRPMADTLTAEPKPASESVLDKLRRLLFKVVTVRAVGDGSGGDLPGLVARIEAALGRNAVGEAAAAWGQLPEAARGTTAAWGERLKGRAAADEAARRIGAQALAGLETVTR